MALLDNRERALARDILQVIIIVTSRRLCSYLAYSLLNISVVDPDLHRDEENGSGTDPGSIKGCQNKVDKKLFFFLKICIRFIVGI